MSLLAKEMSLMFHQNISNLSPMIMSPDSGPKSSSSGEVMLLHIYIRFEMSGIRNEPERQTNSPRTVSWVCEHHNKGSFLLF